MRDRSRFTPETFWTSVRGRRVHRRARRALALAASAVDAKGKAAANSSAVRKKTESPAAAPRRLAAAARHRAGAARRPTTRRRRRSRSTARRCPAASAPDPVVQSSPGTAAAPALGLGFDGVGQGFSGPPGTFTVDSAPPDPNGAVGPNHYVQIVNDELRGLQQDGHAGLRAGADEHALERLRRRLPDEQRRRRDGRVRPARRPLGHQPVLGQHDAVPAVRRRLDDRRPDRRVLPLLVPVRELPRLPEARRLAGRVLHDLQHVHATATTFAGAGGLRLRPREDAGRRRPRRSSASRSSTRVRRPAARPTSTARRRRRPARRTTSLSFGTNSAAALEVPRRLDDAGEHDADRPDDASRSPSFSPACSGGGTCIPQSGTTQKLDSLADRLMYRLAYRNFGDHESLVVNHSVTAGSSRRRALVRAAQPERRRRRSTSRAPTRPTRATAGWAAIAMDQQRQHRARLQRLEHRRCTRPSATPAGSPATRSAR